MTTRMVVFALAWSLSLFAQHRRFSWQDACFKNPAAPFCDGHEYAVKPVRPGKDVPPRTGVPAPPPTATPSGIDWRFADPFADVLAGFNFSKLSASPQARTLIAQLVSSQHPTEADLGKIFAGLCGAEKVGLSVHNNQIVMMLTGSAPDSVLPALEPGWKAVPALEYSLLLGHTEAVDRAVQRIAMAGPPPFAEEPGATSDFWATGPSGLPGVKRVSLTVSIQDRVTADAAFELDGVPDAKAIPAGAVIEGNVAHVRIAGELQPVPLAQRLAPLLMAARYLPQHNPPGTVHTKPVIYGLDSGPKEVSH